MLSGWLQSGKDTVGNLLCKNHGFQRFAFADILKDEVHEIYGIPRHLLDCNKGKREIWKPDGRTVRQILIDHGQGRRKENVEYWILKVLDKIRVGECSRLVITDWRFPNEYDVISSHLSDNYRVLTWRVDRWTVPPLVNETEQALDEFTFDNVISNKGSMHDLKETVTGLCCENNIRGYFLTDIDDCLLYWLEGFKEYAVRKGHHLADAHPKEWDMTGWILDSTGRQLAKEDVLALIQEFNDSPEFGQLEGDMDAVETLQFLKQNGFFVVAISSCTDNKTSFQRRKNNIRKHFGATVDKVICLPLGHNKKDILSQFPPSYWVDDKDQNVMCGIQSGHTGLLMSKPWNVHCTEVQKIDSWKALWNIVCKDLVK